MIVLVLITIVLTGYIYAVTRNLPNVEIVLQEGINPTKWTQVLAANGTPIMSFGKYHHQSVSLKSVSPYFIDALIATEDRRFYTHAGVDPIGIARAIFRGIVQKKISQGGSTITQQLARNVFLNSERTLSRKIREAVLAIKIEQKLTKDQILELYINNTYFGEGAYGIKAASEVYFGKSPATLNISEAALLAGLPQAPSGYSPYQNPEGAKSRRNEVLQNLVEVGKITPAQRDRFQNQRLHLSRTSRKLASADKYPFFNRYILSEVMKRFNLDEQSFWQSGLKVYTTLDTRAQKLAEHSVTRYLQQYGRNKPKEQAALVTLDAKTGEVLAYVGGKNFAKSQYDRVSQAIRSPGSLFKVFTYTTAIDSGYEPTRVYLDEPFSNGSWTPQNYDKSHHGHMTLARALITSNNIVAVKLMAELGADSVIATAEQMGIHTEMKPYLGLTLGGSGVRLLEITSAFGVLANQGVRVSPHGIARILDEAGNEIYRERPSKANILNRSTVDTMVRLMQGVIAYGTGRAANITRPAAGKTGTSDDYHDAWFVGFTPSVVTGVWVGNDDNSTMRGMTGGGLPAAMWKGYMSKLMASKPPEDFDLAYSKPINPDDFFHYNLQNWEEPASSGQTNVLLDEDGNDASNEYSDGSDYPGGRSGQERAALELEADYDDPVLRPINVPAKTPDVNTPATPLQSLRQTPEFRRKSPTRKPGLPQLPSRPALPANPVGPLAAQERTARESQTPMTGPIPGYNN
ncbi:MAG: PBP1A family penicillin-binding protein [Cyanobacteria bacterium P01_H01_bin.74]